MDYLIKMSSRKRLIVRKTNWMNYPKLHYPEKTKESEWWWRYDGGGREGDIDIKCERWVGIGQWEKRTVLAAVL